MFSCFTCGELLQSNLKNKYIEKTYIIRYTNTPGNLYLWYVSLKNYKKKKKGNVRDHLNWSSEIYGRYNMLYEKGKKKWDKTRRCKRIHIYRTILGCPVSRTPSLCIRVYLTTFWSPPFCPPSISHCCNFSTIDAIMAKIWANQLEI